MKPGAASATARRVVSSSGAVMGDNLSGPAGTRDVRSHHVAQLGAVGPAGVVAQEQGDLLELVRGELPVAQCGTHLDVGHVGVALRREGAQQERPTVAVGQARPRPDLPEEVVGGVGEEVPRTVGHLEAVHLGHHGQAARAGLADAAVGSVAHRALSSSSSYLVGRPRPAWRRAISPGPTPTPVPRSRNAIWPIGRSTSIRSASPRARERSFSPRPRTWVKTPCQKSSASIGAVVSRSIMAPAPPVIASVWRTTRPSLVMSIPAASASRDASDAAVKEMKCSRLRASFICVPAPTSPAWTGIAAQSPRTGLIASYTSLGPPTITASSHCSAPGAPP